MDHKSILENAPLPLVIIQDTRIVYANRAFLAVTRAFGYDFDEESVVGVHLMDLVPAEEREESSANIAHLLTAQDDVQRNKPEPFVSADGERHTALVSTSRIEWEGRPALVGSFVVLGVDAHSAAGVSPVDGMEDHRRQALVSLTPREREVAHQVANGYSTDNVAAMLSVEESTVRSHIKSIFKKTGTRSRIELTRLLIGFK